MRGFVGMVAAARLEPYREFWRAAGSVEPSDAAINALYSWQVTMASAWYKVLSYTEVIVRNAIDQQLQIWNTGQGRGPQWIKNPATPLSRILEPRANKGARPMALLAA